MALESILETLGTRQEYILDVMLVCIRAPHPQISNFFGVTNLPIGVELSIYLLMCFLGGGKKNW